MTQRRGSSRGFRSTNILPGTVNNEDVSMSSFYDEDFSLPEPVFLKRADFDANLSLTFNNGGPNQGYDFLVEDTIIEYRPSIGKEERYRCVKKYDSPEYKYCYLKDYVLVGVPTERYKWLFERANDDDNFRKLSHYIQSQNDEYTWLIAEMEPSQVVNCTMYVDEIDGLELVGPLSDKMDVLKSNVIGVGKFKISTLVAVNREDCLYCMKFMLKEFQIINKTDKCNGVQSFVSVQPPDDLMNALRNS